MFLQGECVGDVSRSGLAGTCAFGIISRSCPAALWPFLSRAPGEEGGFQQGSLPVPSLRRASCWLSPSSERRWRRSDATYGTRKSTPRSTAGSQREVSLWAPQGRPPALAWSVGLQLNHSSLTVREQSSGPGASGGVGAAWPDSHSVAGTREASVVPRVLGRRGLHPQVAMSSRRRSCQLSCTSSTWNWILCI